MLQPRTSCSSKVNFLCACVSLPQTWLEFSVTHHCPGIPREIICFNFHPIQPRPTDRFARASHSQRIVTNFHLLLIWKETGYRPAILLFRNAWPTSQCRHALSSRTGMGNYGPNACIKLGSISRKVPHLKISMQRRYAYFPAYTTCRYYPEDSFTHVSFRELVPINCGNLIEIVAKIFLRRSWFCVSPGIALWCINY